MDEAGTVLVPVDFSPHAWAAAVRACEIARACDAEVRLIHAAGTPADRTESSAADGSEGKPNSPSEELESWRASLEEFGPPISAIVEEEDPVALIARHALAQNVRLVVMGMHGYRGLGRVFLGSVADRALRAAEVPIMLVKENEQAAGLHIRRILLATDFSPSSEHALRLAIQWARRLQADIEVLHSIHESDDGRDYPRPRDCASRSGSQRANALEALRSILSRAVAAGVRAVADLTYGAASVEIVKHAARSHADLVVIGLRGQTGQTALGFGSVTERVLRHVKCAVLVAPQERGPAGGDPKA